MEKIANIDKFIQEHPYNCTIDKRYLYRLITCCYQVKEIDITPEQLVNQCLARYGGTVAEALIDYLYNKTI